MDFRTIKVDDSTKISEILDVFTDSKKDLILIDENSVFSQPHLELLTDYPRKTATALVAPLYNGETRVIGDRVVGAGSAFHTAGGGTATFVGALRLSQNQRKDVIAALNEMEKSGVYGHSLDLILVALVRSGIYVASAQLTFAPYARSKDANLRSKIKSEIDSINEGRLRLRMANRANDGFFSVFVLRKFSKLFTWAAVRLRVTPNQITLISFAIGLLSAYEFSRGDFWSIFTGALLLQLSIIVDCVDANLRDTPENFQHLERG